MNTLATHPGQHAVIQQQQSFSPAPAAMLPLQPVTEKIHSRIDRFPNTYIRDAQQSGPSKVRSIAFQFIKDSSVASLGVVGFGLAAKTAIENPILTGILLGGACLLGAVGANAQSTNETDTDTNPVTDPIVEARVSP